MSAVKGHLFKLMRPALSRKKDLHEILGKMKNNDYIEIVEDTNRGVFDVITFKLLFFVSHTFVLCTVVRC
jgi:hypothetical protein